MLKRILLGAAALVLIALAILVLAFFRADIARETLEARYGNAASRYIALPSGAVAHVRDQGNRDGPVLVLVHGSNASLHTWEPWVADLGDSFRIVTVDMPGHGLTGAVPDGDYSRARMAAFTREVTQALGLGRFTLGGNSMGGGVTLEYAVSYPQDLEAIILVCAAGIARGQDEAASGDAARSFSLVSMPGVSQALRWLTPRFLFEDGLKGAVVDPSLVTDEMVDRYLDLNVMEGTREATRARFALPRVPLADDQVRAIALPALVMWGAQDPLIPLGVGERMAALLPDATLVVYEDAGHIPMEEVPARSAADVRAFMAANGLAP